MGDKTAPLSVTRECEPRGGKAKRPSRTAVIVCAYGAIGTKLAQRRWLLERSARALAAAPAAWLGDYRNLNG